MAGVNVTVRLDENIKHDFDSFCESVGMNITTAFNMFIRATLRTRELPFAVTDSENKKQAGNNLLEALHEAQAQSIINDTSDMTLDEINEIIDECRGKK